MPKLLMALNLLISVGLPLVVLIFYPVWVRSPFMDSWFSAAAHLSYFFMVMPVTAVYGGIVFFDSYPKKVRDGLILFIPFVAMVAYTLVTAGSGDLMRDVVQHATAYFVALNAIFIVGVAYLALTSEEATFGRVATLIAIATPFLLTTTYFLLVGLHAASRGDYWSLAGGLYLFEIILVISVYYPKLAKLYIEGKL